MMLGLFLFLAIAVCADDTNDFPTLTIGGRTFTNAYVATFNATDAWIYSRQGGGGKFKLSNAPPEVQARCHYDPAVEARLNAQAQSAAKARQDADHAADAIANVYQYAAPGTAPLRGMGGSLEFDKSFGWRRFSIRMLGIQPVNLAPLIKWWEQAYELSTLKASVEVSQTNVFGSNYVGRLPNGPRRGTSATTNVYGSNYLIQLPKRPSTNWYRVYGVKVGENSSGWIVQGCIEKAPGYSRPAKFILVHPPIADNQRFDELHARLAVLTKLAGENGLPRVPYLISSSVHPDGSIAKEIWVSADPQYHALAEPIWEELDTMPPGSIYHVDFFAAKIGYIQDTNHLEVFDLGQIR